MSWFRKLRKKFGKKKGYRFPNGVPRVEDSVWCKVGVTEEGYPVFLSENLASFPPSQTILDVLESNEDQ